MRKILSLFCLALLFPLVSCNDYTIPEDALYPLKIGVLVPTDTAPAADESHPAIYPTGGNARHALQLQPQRTGPRESQSGIHRPRRLLYRYLGG